mmetsp:Transcript_157993/g.291308  ORF Transcript_157993/g.291308 Transcript_157993/m.291308 type:complete len:210 (-) Transcript_157993:51-680(-)
MRRSSWARLRGCRQKSSRMLQMNTVSFWSRSSAKSICSICSSAICARQRVPSACVRRESTPLQERSRNCSLRAPRRGNQPASCRRPSQRRLVSWRIHPLCLVLASFLASPGHSSMGWYHCPDFWRKLSLSQHWFGQVLQHSAPTVSSVWSTARGWEPEPPPRSPAHLHTGCPITQMVHAPCVSLLVDLMRARAGLQTQSWKWSAAGPRT